MRVRRACWRAVASARAHPLLALSALAALCASVLRAPVHLARSTAFPSHSPAALAHLLADFSTHPHSAHAWRVEEERGNYTEWSYRVAFECGARCTGEASVRAASVGAPAHGHAPRHAVRAELHACTRPPLLPWPRACEWLELEWQARAAGGGSELLEQARAQCSVLRVLTGACARDLHAHADAHLDSLRARLLHIAD